MSSDMKEMESCMKEKEQKLKEADKIKKEKKKKKIWMIAIGVVIALALAAVGGFFGFKAYEEKDRYISDFCSNDPEKIESITILDGVTGGQVQVAKENFSKVTEVLGEVVMPGIYKSEVTKVYPLRYVVIINEGKKETRLSVYSVKCSIGKKEYNLEDGDALAEKLGRLYEMYFEG